MRPVNLKITAFGSYTDTTEIDFTDLQSNLYLITGETGAGKTTIFDAIMFALYGSASGTGRDANMMHSDAVDIKIPTQVTLVFSHQGREYTVERIIKAQKERKTGEYKLKSPEATLIESDGRVISGAGKVTTRCEELIGLNADQFRKIVMLAQGEFRVFLKADTKARAAILEKLFDNSEYKRFQALISGSRDQLKAERNQYDRAIEIALDNFDKTGMNEEQQLLYMAGHSRLSANLASLAEADAARLKELTDEKNRLQANLNALNTKKGAADKDNKLLDELKDKREHLSVLQSQSEEMAGKRSVYEKAEKAFHQVRPLEEAKKEAERAVRTTRESIEKSSRQLAADEKALEQAQAASEAQQANRDLILKLNTEIDNITKALPVYEQVLKLEAQAEKAVRNARAAETAVKTAKAEEENCRDRREEILSELETLEGVDGLVADTQHAYNKAEQDLSQLNDVKKQIGDIAGQKTVLLREQKKLADLSEKAAKANRLHYNLYQRFIAGQSGLLAEQLELDIEANGEAACPVCRTVFYKGSQFNFAVRQTETPSEKQVNEAKDAFDAAEKARQAQQTKVDRYESTVNANMESVVADAGKLLPDCGDWEMLSAPGYLTEKIADFTENMQDANSRRKEAAERRDRRDQLKKDEKKLADRLETLKKQEEEQQQKLNTYTTDAEKKKTEAAALKSGLAYAAKDEAENAFGRKSDERGQLQKEVRQAEDELKKAVQKKASTEGNLKSENDRLPLEEKKAAEAEEALAATVANAGFSGIEAVHTALQPMAGYVPEKWLRDQQRLLNEYNNDVKNTAVRIDELSVSTKDLHYTDLAKLQTEINDLSSKCSKAEASCVACSKRADNHRETERKVAAAQQHLISTDAMWKRLDRLADLAMGGGGTGGLLSFDRYVMGSVFEDILQMANARLDTMSGGQYELVHSESAVRSNAQAGLDIEVLDHLTGKCRKADSLSGGEGFQASLALALGLSDVVQSRAGGTGIDALFIDEGFGSLDEGVLDKAIDVLKQLTDGNRLVGVISHVSRLEESITSKIVVTKPAGKGSCVQILN